MGKHEAAELPPVARYITLSSELRQLTGWSTITPLLSDEKVNTDLRPARKSRRLDLRAFNQAVSDEYRVEAGEIIHACQPFRHRVRGGDQVISVVGSIETYEAAIYEIGRQATAQVSPEGRHAASDDIAKEIEE